MLGELISGNGLEDTIRDCIREIHSNGPNDPNILERLAYVKKLHPSYLESYEPNLINVMGLFYKSGKPQSLLDEVYSIYADSIIDETGTSFTPIQANAFNQINLNKYFSFSAPTSIGKSYLFRQIISSSDSDVVIVVPSRALISEYFQSMAEILGNDVLLLQFVEDVDKIGAKRRVFVITPERGGDLFRLHDRFNIGLFLFDEAQISEETVRGVTFDALVRRADRVFPNAKKVFAHPFVTNPIAQLEKHGFRDFAEAQVYSQQSTGKIFVTEEKGEFSYFSPHDPKNSYTLDSDLAHSSIASGGTMLVYTSKSNIYDATYVRKFGKYVDLCPTLTHSAAAEIIEALRKYIGASKEAGEKHSLLLEMMARGVVVHHGSMPLKARLLIEQFIRAGFAKICFATSTLSQGINMPFDVVWLDNFYDMTALNLKNLIGRAGRTKAEEKNSFDFGHVIVRGRNKATFIRRYGENYSISNESQLDSDPEELDVDDRDLVEAIKTETYNDDYRMPEIQVQRLGEVDIKAEIRFVLDNLTVDGKPISGAEYYNVPDVVRRKIKSSFKSIYLAHLRRKKLTLAESSVLSAAIPILLWHIQGKSFSEMVSLRYSFLAEKDKQRDIERRRRRGELTLNEATEAFEKLKVRFSPIASKLPNKSAANRSLFGRGMSVSDLDYDTLVYDTYDYLDKVVSLSLADPICAALQIFSDETGDKRALVLQNFIRYGTDDSDDIWLLKYGFDAEDLEWLKEHVEQVNEDKLSFKESIHAESEQRIQIVSRYLR